MTTANLTAQPHADSGQRPRRRRTTGTSTPQRPAASTQDEVLVPVTGILDVRDNYGFVRTSGYLTGPDDVYVSAAQLTRHGLRRGDAIVGTARANDRQDKRN